ncbi:MAG: NAD-dependent succinate-semialdehyde dehydrogenase [Streptosporangiaceae bacterium]
MSNDVASLTGIDVPTGLLIGGEWTGAHGGARLPVVDPATEDALTDVADATEADALAAVSAAYAALPGWSATPPRQRAECLRRAFELMTDRGEQIARLMSAENGKSLRDARAELTYAAEFFRWYAEEAVRIDGNLTVAPAGANKILVTRQPIGVSVLVTPWNFPAAMATRKLGPALAAGCTVVLKPAGETPLTALAVAGLLEEAGVPAGVVNVVPTSQPGPVVAAMMADSRVRKLSFTGSTEVGRILLRQAAATVLSCSMELGGNAPFIVFDDADLDAAVQGALIAKMRNGGEACTAANRFYVHEAVADEFTARLTDAFGKLTVGPGLEESTDVGPLVNEETRSKVSALVEGAGADGGQVLLGGRAPDRRGYFYEPTVIGQVPPTAKILGSEIFGPVAPVVRFSDEAELIDWANATEYGLVSYVYTRQLSRGLRVSEALETGMVGLNRGLVSDPAAPFGGVKQSGLGREGGHDGLLEFLETKYIAAQW